MRMLACLVLLLAAAGCARPLAPAGTAVLGPEAVRAGGSWSSGGRLELAVTLARADGRVAVCGAWTTTPQSVLSERHNAAVLETGTVRVGGRRAVTGLGFFTRLERGAAFEGATARCVATPLDWGAGPGEVTVHLPPRQFEYDEESGYLAKFRQTAVSRR